jgi:hypothetical protein
MFYDNEVRIKDSSGKPKVFKNPRLSKNIPHVIVNNKQEFKTFLKSLKM